MKQKTRCCLKIADIVPGVGNTPEYHGCDTCPYRANTVTGINHFMVITDMIKGEW